MLVSAVISILDDFGSLLPARTVTVKPRFLFLRKTIKACNFQYDYVVKTEYMDEEANFILRKAGYDIKPWEGFVQRGSTYGGISKEISHDKLKGMSFQRFPSRGEIFVFLLAN